MIYYYKLLVCFIKLYPYSKTITVLAITAISFLMLDFILITQICLGSSRGPIATSTPNRSQIQEALEDIGIVRTPEDHIQELGVIRPDPAEHLDLTNSQFMDASDIDDYGK